MSFSAYVLAGGSSTRMRTDKALLQFHGLTLIEHALRLLTSLELSPGITPKIAGSRTDLASYAPVVPDLRPGCGPLSGLEAALKDAENELVLFVPVDLPLLPAALLRLMIQRQSLTGALMTVPRFLGQEQPLCAVYHRGLLPPVSQAMDAGDYKVLRVMTSGALALGGCSAIDCFDVETVLAANGDYAGWPDSLQSIFLNCNTPADLQNADSRLARATGTVRTGSSFA